MKKLDDIPKKNIFEVPDGYFDRLPEIIQTRVAGNPAPETGFRLSLSVRYAIALLVLGIGIFWYSLEPLNSDDKIMTELASINSDQLIHYLDEHDVQTDELVEKMTWSPEDLKDLENSVYSNLDVPGKEIERALSEDDSEL